MAQEIFANVRRASMLTRISLRRSRSALRQCSVEPRRHPDRSQRAARHGIAKQPAMAGGRHETGM
ncbi:hypothetical protein D2T29_21620 [Sinirhodobacter populi]|uniref:Uncharacterized protein n=1 Tax=Paenirhodobacter populi TaxID=2306993 RepID=A0A443JZ84_9RHOB|nr:hypothetical protein D2T29_21620 [Sinirhodobacter populi]